MSTTDVRTRWQEIMERGAKTLGYPPELAAAERILDYFQNAGYDVTLILYPMMPITVTEFSRKNVQEPTSAFLLIAPAPTEFAFTSFATKSSRWHKDSSRRFRRAPC